MKIKNPTFESLLIALAAFGITTATQAATTTQDGPWSDPATWGGTLPDNNAFSGQGENNQINHAVTIGATDNFNVRDLNLKQTTTGTLTVATGGNLNLNWDVNLGVQQFNTTTGYTFNFPTRQFRFWTDGGVWTHNGDLDLGTADILNRTANGAGTIAGTGTLSVNQLILNNAANNTFNINRNLIADDLVFSGNAETVDLAFGTFQLDLSITALSAVNLINFSGSDAVFRVESSVFSETDANDAISNSFITDGTGNGLTVGTDAGYTTVSVIPEPSAAILFGGGILLLVGRRVKRG